jgi:Domain of unknown function (DUF3825)
MTEELPAAIPQAAPGQVDPTHVPKTAVLRHMNDFASLGAKLRYERLQRLATLTNDAGEHWDYPTGEGDEAYPVLSRYVDYTFRRVREQDNIVYSADDQWAAFHTGLLNAVYKEIYGVFQRSRDQRSPWFLQDFVTDDDRRLAQFRDLPTRATYFDNPADLVYDTRRRLVWTDHTLMDREIRFPESLQGDDPDSVERRRRAIHAAVRHATFRVQQSYRTAVPQFYWPRDGSPGRLQLLLPLCLEVTTRADLAFAVERDGETYRAFTPLRLAWAYSNARLITKPESDWLSPH